MTAEEYLEEMDKSSNDINDIIEEAIVGYARLKCQELLLLVAEKAKTKVKDGYIETTFKKEWIEIDRDSILNAVDLENFCS